ncbi:glycosyltransferase family 4 protein [Mucilaginibacter sp.]|jgi:glycosyltransferase involved in cell wall biosynthesis|uniref:glycosyltransferase family 4 protein n=1 Tax=Mucilaginibacter sp. TaxID=1882438 RepID=UPI003562D18D
MATNKIKIFVDAHVFDKEFQGAQTFIRELYTRLLADHPDLDIYFGASNTANISTIFPDLPKANILPYKKRGIGLLRFVFDIPALIKKHQFNFAHFQYVAPKNSPGCKYVVTMHDVLFNDFKQDFSYLYRISRNLLFGNSIKRAHIKTTVSVYSQQRICSYYNIPETDLHVIQNGVNDTLTQFHSSKKEAVEIVAQKFGVRNFILYTSRVEPRKNQLLLFNKYLKLELYKRGIALVFIGKESIKIPALTQLIKGLSDEQKKLFYWIKQVDQPDLAAFYRACRLFVYPSKAEGFGIPPLEAAICKAPVLCSSATAMQSFHFFEPYMFDPVNEKDLERKLSLMIHSPPSDSFTAKVAKQVQQQYNWEKSSNIFYNLIQSNYNS